MMRTVGALLGLGHAVHTPYGERPAECVVEIPDGATFYEHNGGLTIKHNGMEQFRTVHPSCHTDDVAKKLAHRRLTSRSDARRPADVGKWMDNSAYTHTPGYSGFSAKYSIPSDPANAQGQILYYFIGLQNNGDGELNILQPVLAWKHGGWEMASWACCPSNISTTSSSITKLRAGQTVEANIERVDDSTWKIDSKVNGKSSTLTAEVGSYKYTWADVTLEIYKISDCSQYSSGKMHFTELSLTGADGEQVSPSWSQPPETDCQGEVTIKNSGSIDISHNGGNDPSSPPTEEPATTLPPTEEPATTLPPSEEPATTKPSSPSDCVDDESDDNLCSFWKDEGYCKSSNKHFGYMQKHCCQTCGLGYFLV